MRASDLFKLPAPRIEDAWHGYRALVIEGREAQVDVADVELAYKAGAAVLFQIMLRMMDPGQEPT